MLINNLLGGAGGLSRYMTFNQAGVQEMTLETGGMCVDPAGNGRQSFRAVKHREKRGHVRQERLDQVSSALDLIDFSRARQSA